MKEWKILIYLLILFPIGFPLVSQSPVDIEKTLIISYAEGDDIALHFKALELMEKRFLETKELDNDLMGILKAMAKYSIMTEVYEDGILIKTNQEVQLEAIKILGKIGGQEALDSMTALLTHCQEYPVLYETVSSSALIKGEDYGDFLDAMVKAMKSQHYTNMDNGFAYASLYTLESLMTNYGVLLTPDLIKVLLLYSENAYMHRVQDYAIEILKKY